MVEAIEHSNHYTTHIHTRIRDELSRIISE